MAEQRVMGWYNNTGEPKRSNRFELLLSDNLRVNCYSATIPSVKVEEVSIHRMHTLYKVAGSKVTYQDISLKFYDFVDNLAAKELKAWYDEIYSQTSSLMGYPKDYKRDISLLVYGPDHSVVETWVLVGAWPDGLSKDGGLDWSQGTGTHSWTVNLKIDEARLVLA